MLFAGSPGIYGILIASPQRVLAERYSAFGASDRATASWSMTRFRISTENSIKGVISSRVMDSGVR